MLFGSEIECYGHKLYNLPLSVVKLFQDTGSLELEETEREVNDVAFSTAIFL